MPRASVRRMDCAGRRKISIGPYRERSLIRIHRSAMYCHPQAQKDQSGVPKIVATEREVHFPSCGTEAHAFGSVEQQIYSGKFIRCIRSWKHGSERKSSKQGST